MEIEILKWVTAERAEVLDRSPVHGLKSASKKNDELLIAKPKQSTHKRENEKWKLFF